MINRREFIVSSMNSAAIIGMIGCGAKTSDAAQRGTNGSTSAPTLDELNLLNDFKLRKSTLSDNSLIISNREFDLNVRFDGFHWENTQFINCYFSGCFLFRAHLKNIRFENCTFIGSRFEEGRWENVSFIRCAGRGRLSLGTDSGKNTIYDDCEFIGATPAELGYGGPADSYAGIGGGDGDVTYNNCNFRYIFINGGSSLKMLNCALTDVFVVGRNKSKVLLENISGNGMVKCENIETPATSITIKNSTFVDLSLTDVDVDTVLLENTKGNIDFFILKAQNVTLRKVTFLSTATPNIEYKYGLRAESVKIQHLLIEDCLIGGKQVALYLMGEPINEQVREKAIREKKKFINLSSTTFGTLTIRNTPVIMGHMEYMEVGTLLLENLTVHSANFSHGEFGQFILRNVVLSGVVDFTGTKIKERIYDRVENTATGTQPTILKP